MMMKADSSIVCWNNSKQWRRMLVENSRDPVHMLLMLWGALSGPVAFNPEVSPFHPR
jgi:hypothetical protein